ncbi:carbon-nitrogen hydrolase family protein [Sphingomonas sp. LY160]|uniref:carbon-nitrogen hydrolase family protein n=1 Tax=Sphingomonas sp. LY160 TaxID=3095342 RepID=UPI002ADEA86F|nr:carbon-nitrogen hydrolase family protein [Sphingomonas sp. LY160]MEA1073270.1 carbon-nitrogen hydrolase family protein [Sphingomonas sp. LY160]
MSPVRIALYQAQSGVDPAVNARALVGAVAEAAAGGARMLFTPEMSGMLDRDRERAMGKARAEGDDAVLAAVRAAAAKHGIWVHLGSLAVLAEGGKLANRGFVIDDAGEVRGRYDKIHLFDVDLPTGESWRESAMYRGGDEAVVVPGTPVGTLGLTICYDLRFPALFERLSEAGADVIAVPAAFTVPTGQAHWQVLMRARAIEAALFVVAAAQAGTHEDGRVTYGHSLVADPWGEVLTELGDEPGLAFAEIDPGKIAEVRARVPVMQHRRMVPPIMLPNK